MCGPSHCAFFINILPQDLVGRHVAVADSWMFNFEEFLSKYLMCSK